MFFSLAGSHHCQKALHTFWMLWGLYPNSLKWSAKLYRVSTQLSPAFPTPQLPSLSVLDTLKISSGAPTIAPHPGTGHVSPFPLTLAPPFFSSLTLPYSVVLRTISIPLGKASRAQPIKLPFPNYHYKLSWMWPFFHCIYQICHNIHSYAYIQMPILLLSRSFLNISPMRLRTITVFSPVFSALNILNICV